MLAGFLPAKRAEAQGLPLIRDTEIELLLNDYSQGIFRAAGLGTGRVTVRIVNNEAFNAFVIDGRNVFDAHKLRAAGFTYKAVGKA